MTPIDIYNQVYTFSSLPTTIICDLHSACSPQKKKSYLCIHAGSKTPVIDFDNVKTRADIAQGVESRKSVDALTVSPSRAFLCFIELKSWDLLITYNGSEKNVRKQVAKYSSDLPTKLSDSMQICEEITNNPDTFDECKIIYILITDISVEDDGISALSSDLMALAGISSDLKELCNSLSKGVMDGITSVETRYWECRSFDRNISVL
jgi:hypothetical protein